MERYIHVDTLIDYIDWDNDIEKWTLRREPEDIPASDVEIVRYAKWIPFATYDAFKCSECGRVEFNKEPYCHCGAKMDKQ